MKALVVTIRGCHLGYLGCYGCDWIATPTLDRLAASGTVFDRHYANVPDPVAARRSWRNGRHHFPAPEAIHVPASLDLIASLRSASVRTVLLADARFPLPDEWLEGWDEVELVPAEGPDSQLERILERAREALADLADEPSWLLWIDLATLLPPWNVPSDFSSPFFQIGPGEDEEDERPAYEEGVLIEGEEDPLIPWPDPPIGPIDTQDDIDFCRLQSTLAGAVSYLDAGLGVILEQMEKLGLFDDCLIVVTGDHGQALGEHGFQGSYRPWLHDELVHLPLVVKLPTPIEGEGNPRGLRIPALTQAVDLPATLLDWFGQPLPDDLHGISLFPAARAGTDSLSRDYVCCGLRLGEAMEWSLRTAEWSFLLPLRTVTGDPPRQPLLYVKPDDRWEVNDVLHHHIERAEAFERTLRAFMTASRAGGELRIPPLEKPTYEPSATPDTPPEDGADEEPLEE